MKSIFSADCHLKSTYRNGNLDTVLVGERVELETSLGKLVPRYTIASDSGRKKEAPIKFFPTGELKVLPLEDRTEVDTSIGKVNSELLVFYKSGALRRTFPLNGKVNGFWTEENEFSLAEVVDIPTSLGTISVKPIYLQFYETGELESILFWPSERVRIQVGQNDVLIKLGITFYKNGQVKTFEPESEIALETPIGTIKAYDPDPNGMHAERNSVSYYEDGSVQSITTSSNKIIVNLEGVEIQEFAPKEVPGYCNQNTFFINPLIISFNKDSNSFQNVNGPEETVSREHDFRVEEFIATKPISCVGCG